MIGPWTYQRCTEFVMSFSVAQDSRMFLPGGEVGDKQRFHRNKWSWSKFADFCKERVGVAPADSEQEQAYWGASGWKAQPRLILSNGRLDPWGYGGIREAATYTADGARLFWINQSAHHLDLRAANPADPPSVTQARHAEVETVAGWLHALNPG
jgi:lysosomal Pro-X carboxypeptidase